MIADSKGKGFAIKFKNGQNIALKVMKTILFGIKRIMFSQLTY